MDRQADIQTNRQIDRQTGIERQADLATKDKWLLSQVRYNQIVSKYYD
jgi:hypothetical protein